MSFLTGTRFSVIYELIACRLPGHYICEAVAETGLLVSLDIMVRRRPTCIRKCIAHFILSVFFSATQEVNPSLEDSEAVAQTISIGRSLARSALGESPFLSSLTSPPWGTIQKRLNNSSAWQVKRCCDWHVEDVISTRCCHRYESS
jgi:hypothetical protein